MFDGTVSDRHCDTMKLTRSQIFDRIHRAGVISMLALTGFGAVILGLRTYRYFTGEWLSMSRCCLARRLRVYLDLPCGLVLVVMVFVLGCGCWLSPFTVLVLVVVDYLPSLPSDTHHIQSSHVFKIALKTHFYKQYHSHISNFVFFLLPPPPPPGGSCCIPSVGSCICVYTLVCACVLVCWCVGVREILFYMYNYL